MIIDSPIVSGSASASGSLNQHGDVVITGSLTVTGPIIGALTGSVDSASFAQTAVSASFAQSAISSSYTETASFAISSSWLDPGYLASSASYAITASYAHNAALLNNSGSGEFVPTGSFNIFSSSILTYTGSNNTNISNIHSTTASLNTFTGSADSRLSSIESTTASLNTFSGSAQSQLTSLQAQTGSYATTGSNIFVDVQYISSSASPTGFTTTASLYTDGGLRVGRDAYVSGTLYLNNVTVFGTQSISYITSSQLNISTNLITVNTDTPSVRFGGLAVYDSGSTGLTGSLLWDSENNHWVYSNPSGSSYSGGMFISGPRSATLGSEQGTTACRVLVGQGGDHLTSSLIYHDSATTCIPNTLIGNTVCASQLRICSTGDLSYIYNSGASTTDANFYIYNSTSDILMVRNSGCVGLNIANPQARLDIAGNNNALGCANTLRFTDTDTATEANQQIGKIEFYSSDTSTPGAGVKAYMGAFASDTTPDAYLSFATQDGSLTPDPVERLRITSEGNLQVGYSGAPNIAGKLFISRGDQYGLTINAFSGGNCITSTDDNIYFTFGTNPALRMICNLVSCFAGTVCAPRLQVFNTNSIVVIEGTATNGEGTLTIAGKNSSGTSRSAIFKYDNADIIRVATADAIPMRFETSDVTRLTISSTGIATFACQVCAPVAIISGCVGIGTTTPNEKLQVNSSIGIRSGSGSLWGALRFGTTCPTYYTEHASIESDNEGVGLNVSNLKFYTSFGSKALAMTITADQARVGIGTCTPQKKLDIFTSVNSSTEYQLSVRNGAGANSVSSGIVFGFNSVSLDPDYLSAISSIITNRTTRAADLTFLTAATGTLVERLRITSSGSILPGANGTQDLGSSSLRWCTVYTSDLSLNNGIGNYTIVEGENDLFLYNNNSCKVYKFIIQEVCPEIAPAKRSI